MKSGRAKSVAFTWLQGGHHAAPQYANNGRFFSRASANALVTSASECSRFQRTPGDGCVLPAPIAAATAGVTACSIAVATLGASVFASPCGREQADASSAITTIQGPALNGGRNNKSGTVRADT